MGTPDRLKLYVAILRFFVTKIWDGDGDVMLSDPLKMVMLRNQPNVLVG